MKVIKRLGAPLQVAWLFALCVVTAGQAMENNTDTQTLTAPTDGLWYQEVYEEIERGWYHRLNLIGFGLTQQPVLSQLNPDNALNLPRYQLEMDLRPDFALTYRRLDLGISPRFDGLWERWDDGTLDGQSEVNAQTFINEWHARYRLADEVIASYGRENLQWGPSYLLSVSNPFNRINGRTNPMLQVPGLDYGRVIWIPSLEWSASFIANTGEGALPQIQKFGRGAAFANTIGPRASLQQGFQKTYALKVDYTGIGKTFSLIPSWRGDNEFMLGYFGIWNATDAWILYVDGSMPKKLDETDVLVGSTYALDFGPNVTIEYFRNGNGCTKEPIDLCLVPGASDLNSTDVFVRRNYLMFQLVEPTIRNFSNATVRWTQNLDDGSSSLIGILVYELGKHMEPYLVGNMNLGGTGTEFGSILRYSLMAGLSVTFY